MSYVEVDKLDLETFEKRPLIVSFKIFPHANFNLFQLKQHLNHILKIDPINQDLDEQVQLILYNTYLSNEILCYLLLSVEDKFGKLTIVIIISTDEAISSNQFFNLNL